MGVKNSRINLDIETSLKNILKKEAEENGISLAQLCRLKITENSRLTKIEYKLNEHSIILKKICQKIERGRDAK